MTTFPANDLQARLEAATMPGLIRTVEWHPDGLIVISCHSSLSREQEAAMTAIAGPTARFVP